MGSWRSLWRSPWSYMVFSYYWIMGILLIWVYSSSLFEMKLYLVYSSSFSVFFNFKLSALFSMFFISICLMSSVWLSNEEHSLLISSSIWFCLYFWLIIFFICRICATRKSILVFCSKMVCCCWVTYI